jgi:hypothetical protein
MEKMLDYPRSDERGVFKIGEVSDEQLLLKMHPEVRKFYEKQQKELEKLKAGNGEIK